VTEVERRLRRDALAIFRAALAAVDPELLVRDALGRGSLEPAPPGGRILLLAVGKAAVPMARAAAAVLGDALSEGVVLAPAGPLGQLPDRLRLHQGGHPLPDRRGMEGARDIAQLARQAGPLDRILLLLSGGGSSLLTLPHPDVALDDLRRVTELMLLDGATIGDLNTVRKHLETLKGGRLAALAQPATVTALVLSDVVGDPLDVIGSGPVSPDTSTFEDAIVILERRGLWNDAPPAVRQHLLESRMGRRPETPKEGDPIFQNVRVSVVGSAALAARRASEEAARMGYHSRVAAVDVTGEAREVGASLATNLRALLQLPTRPVCHVSAGETTVTVRGSGSGGRNQELALAAALGLDRARAALVLSAGTDGLDGPTDAAGALVTGSTLGRARALGLDPQAYLERNDSYRFFEALDDLIKTGPTGTNVMDLMLVMAGEERETPREPQPTFSSR
jgi:hydroxypyruvate reductase